MRVLDGMEFRGAFSARDCSRGTGPGRSGYRQESGEMAAIRCDSVHDRPIIPPHLTPRATRMRSRILPALIGLALIGTPLPVGAQVVLDETFSGPAAGWTTDAEWQIGATSVGPPPAEGTFP